MGVAKITILSDSLRGTSYSLVNEEYKIGRSDSADISISDPTISGHHCTLFRTGEGVYAIRDEGSTNGTRVNGQKLEQDAVVLTNSDLLQVGGVEMLFENTEEEYTEARTMTVVNLDDTGTQNISSATMKNLGGKASNKKAQVLRDNKKHNMIMYAILGILGVAVVGALAYLFTTLTAAGN